jgi:opacity protein-like surface antigen
MRHACSISIIEISMSQHYKTFETRQTMTLILLLVVALASYSQPRTHTGLYLSLQAGPEGGRANGNTNQGYSVKVTGPAYGIDFQAGGALAERTLIHGNFGFRSVYNPKVQLNTLNRPAVETEQSLDELMLGVGITRYFLRNYFLTGVAGGARITQELEAVDLSGKSKTGFSWQLKFGKEWWVSSRWSFGAAVEYSGTRANYADDWIEVDWLTYRYGFRLTATFNGSR